LKLIFILIFYTLTFSGCLSTIITLGSVTSAVSRAQEIEEDYDNNILKYTQDKSQKLYYYISKKLKQ
jgi:hypothetical protein